MAAPRRPAPRDAVAVAPLREVPTLCAACVRRAGDPVGTSDIATPMRARCTVCGNKGATIQHPGWGGADIGFLPFPTTRTLPGRIGKSVNIDA